MRVGRRHLSGVEVNISVVKTNPQIMFDPSDDE